MSTESHPITLTIMRTDYAPGVANVWIVEQGETHHTSHRDIDEALFMVGVMMRRIEAEQVHR